MQGGGGAPWQEGLTCSWLAIGSQVRVDTVTKWLRHYGISQWPYRKLKSLDTLMQGLWGLVEEGARNKEEVAAVVSAPGP